MEPGTRVMIINRTSIYTVVSGPIKQGGKEYEIGLAMPWGIEGYFKDQLRIVEGPQ